LTDVNWFPSLWYWCGLAASRLEIGQLQLSVWGRSNKYGGNTEIAERSLLKWGERMKKAYTGELGVVIEKSKVEAYSH